MTELKLDDEPFQALWSALRANRLRPLPNRLAGSWPVDITLRVRNGYLGIRLDEAQRCSGGNAAGIVGQFCRIPDSQIASDLQGCLRTIGAALVDLGGALDSKPGREWKL